MTFLAYNTPSSLGIDISSILKAADPSQTLKDAAAKVGLTQSTLTSTGAGLQNAALTEAAKLATDSNAVVTNRARIAAAVNYGYSVADMYQTAKPGLFIAGVVGTILSSIALTKRRKNPEAVALYAITAAVSVVTAWVTRPALLKGTPPPPPPESNVKGPGPVSSTLQWADNRVAKLTAAQPGWEGATLSRLWGDIGSGTMAPAVQTLLTRKAH